MLLPVVLNANKKNGTLAWWMVFVGCTKVAVTRTHSSRKKNKVRYFGIINIIFNSIFGRMDSLFLLSSDFTLLFLSFFLSFFLSSF